MSEALVWLASEAIRECFGLLMGDLCNPVNCKLRAQQWRISAIFESVTYPCGAQVLQLSSGDNGMQHSDAFKLSCLGDYGLR